MDSFTTEEGSHSLSDKHKLYTKTWKPKSPPKALALFVHGFSDHINRFSDFMNTLASRGIEVHGFDQRGWGRSVTTKSERGLTGSTATVMSDITSMLQPLILLAQGSGVPLFLLGHSMGGGEVLYYAATGPEEVRKQIRGYLALAPYLTLHPASQPSRALVVAGRVALKVLPRYQMLQKLKPDNLSRDPEVAKSWEADELCHNIGTLEGLGGMIDRGEELDNGKAVVKEGNIYIAHGSNDLITNHGASKRFFERLKVRDKTFKSYDGWYHVCEYNAANYAGEIVLIKR
ncbi:uncharacterized protein KY384_008345 [Bacidia gigantensis]|uniref:uncharacterized protein n=1 Tax=Bacidia gigantensis TaxID=2732470 RepID=UPI001D041833|nr:uncharacterized protein KY384_008345 [Bacidia gigantensis]KAG8526916.1 hypothetical protein KY384_008345 [Bacidia gigantensis]